MNHSETSADQGRAKKQVLQSKPQYRHFLLLPANSACVLSAAEDLGGLLAGLCRTHGEDFADSLRVGGQLGAAGAGFGEEFFGGVCQGFFHFAVAEAAAAIERG